ncbi:MAG: hypothetical protein QY318_02470 [Candidatus Dojkabacteria bacterium]|nr:MAG: hypothetical protein QY318_02470 [Candidatus Dojkabacteria bacterium]
MKELFLSSTEAQSDPLAIALFMQAFNQIGNTGDSTWLSGYLPNLAEESDRGMFWEDIESNFKVMGSSDYVTSAAYLALAPLESWDTKYKVRNWLLDRNVNSYYGDKNSAAIMYALAVADSESVADFGKDNNLKLFVNGEEVEDFELTGDSRYSKVVASIDSKYLEEGENVIKIARNGEGELYLTANVKSVTDEIPESKGFTISRSLTDLDSGKPIAESDLQVADVVKVTVKVTPDADYTNVVVRDFVPSGTEPLRFNLAGVSMETMRKFWQYNGVSVDRSGVAAKDYVSFGTGTMEKGKEYSYEYLLVVANKGELSGGSASVFLEMFPDIAGYVSTAKVVID